MTVCAAHVQIWHYLLRKIKTNHTTKCLGAKQAAYHRSLDTAEVHHPACLQTHSPLGSHPYFCFSVLLGRVSFLVQKYLTRDRILFDKGKVGEAGQKNILRYYMELFDVFVILSLHPRAVQIP